MSDTRDGEGEELECPTLVRLGLAVEQRGNRVWRQFVVAQAQVVASRRRNMTTQRIFLIGGDGAASSPR